MGSSIQIGGRELLLQLQWKHERDYHKWFFDRYFSAPIAFDVMLTERFVRKGDVVLDAGANIGFTALLFLQQGVKKICAVEPDPRCFSRISKLDFKEIDSYDFALGDNDGETTLFLSTGHNQGSTLEKRTASRFPNIFPTNFDGKTRIVIPVRKIDSVFQGVNFDVVKIDVEGSELALLKGGAGLFEKSTPRVVLIESYEEFFPDVKAFLMRYYRYSARVVYDRSQENIKLLSTEFKSLDINGDLFFNPPTYVYSREPFETGQPVASVG